MASILKVNTIQDATNSTTAMTIDSSGRVLKPTTPHFMLEKVMVMLEQVQRLFGIMSLEIRRVLIAHQQENILFH